MWLPGRVHPCHFNPRSPHGERRPCAGIPRASWRISIHAPRTGSDLRRLPSPDSRGHFNPRSPHGERPTAPKELLRAVVFQSTLPARGATLRKTPHGAIATIFQSTLPARGATPAAVILADIRLFQSTLPARGATGRFVAAIYEFTISIHAPRTGSDRRYTIRISGTSGISIHAPRTGSDLRLPRSRWRGSISIHAPRTGSDSLRPGNPSRRSHFNPRSPHGERLAMMYANGATQAISIHAPRTGSDA